MRIYTLTCLTAVATNLLCVITATTLFRNVLLTIMVSGHQARIVLGMMNQNRQEEGLQRKTQSSRPTQLDLEYRQKLVQKTNKKNIFKKIHSIKVD